MSANSEKVKSWRKRTKARIVEAMGKSCSICNYNKCFDALALHHLNPEEKELSLGGIRSSPKSWEKIVKELRKCILVCHNCHSEIHNGITKVPKKVTGFNEDYVTYEPVR